MDNRIPQSFIDDVMSRHDIIDVMKQRGLDLKKNGRYYKACCPFHQEKSASFTVYHSKQDYHCFGCGAHGNILRFVMDFDKLGFIDALTLLAEQVNLTLPKQTAASSEQAQTYKALYQLNQMAAMFYIDQLKNHPQANQAQQYLQGRGLSPEIIQRYQIGFAPPGWDNLLNELGHQAADHEALLKVGLVVQKAERKRGYDRFRHRIMFPIRDRRGRVIGFGGRVLSSEDNPKYLNSPETVVYHKGKELYGLYEAQHAHNRLPRLLIVEGYMDVVSLAQAGIGYAVATLGTATTTDQLQVLFRACPHLVFCFDGDAAGKKAAWRALEAALPLIQADRDVRFLFLPEGQDPDSLVRLEGRRQFEARIEQAPALSEVFFDELARSADLQSLDGRAGFAHQAMTYIQRLPEGIFKHMLLDKLSQRVGMQADTLAKASQGQAKSVPTHAFAPQRRAAPRARARLKTMSPMRLFMGLLLQQPAVLAVIDTEPGRSLYQSLDETFEGVALLKKWVSACAADPHSATEAHIENWPDDKEANIFKALQSLPLSVPAAGEAAEALGALNALIKQQTHQKIDGLLAKAKQTPLSDQEKRELNQLITRRTQ